MPSMFHAATRETFQRRILKLTPDAQRRWGRMSAHQMVCHLSDQLRIALGDIAARPIPGLIRYPPMKQLVIDVMPWPRGRVQGPPEAFTTAPAAWTMDISTLSQLLETFAASRDRRQWPAHPLFGRMSASLWSRVTCRHFDHHLTQFGC